MRRVFRGAVLCIAVVALGAALAVPAGATSQVEVVQDSTNLHCPAVAAGGVSGGCYMHAEGELTLFLHFVGMETLESKCHIEGEARTDEDGVGWITSVTMSNGAHGDVNCPTTTPPCKDSLPWPVSTEEDAGNVTASHVDMCVVAGEGSANCEGEFAFPVTETGTTSEVQGFTVNDQRIGTSSFCEDTISVTTEAKAPHEAIHIKSN